MAKKKNNKKKTKVNKKLRIVNIIFLVITTLISIFTIFSLMYTKFMPTKYIMLFSVISLVILAILFYFVRTNKKKIFLNILCNIIAILLISVSVVGINYLYKTYDFLEDINVTKEVDIYYLLTFKENEEINIEEVSTFEDSTESFDKAIEEVNKEYKPTYTSVDNYNSLLTDLKSEKIDYALINKVFIDLYKEDIDTEIYDEIKIIKEIKIETDIKLDNNIVNVKDESFNVYISGIDTYGDISTKSRSDVNIIMNVDPVNHEILLIHIPRDYYVPLAMNGIKDKLGHTGLYGINESIETVENLLDIEIPYYVRVNFDSVIEVVDAIGGVNVYSEYTFDIAGHHFTKGMNYLDGEEALMFSRERKSFTTGDRQRGENQEAVIEAIIDKVASSETLLNNYSKLLSSLSGAFQTNMRQNEIAELVNLQLSDFPDWEITTYNLNGFDNTGSTFTNGPELYVMIPDEKTIDYAKGLLK